MQRYAFFLVIFISCSMLSGQRFTDIQAGLTGVSESASNWIDFDQDGAIDIFVTGDFYKKIITVWTVQGNLSANDGADGADGTSILSSSRTSGDGSEGTTDIYTLWADVGQTVAVGTFDVYNGADGTGGAGAVDSVNGKTGVVVLNQSEVLAETNAFAVQNSIGFGEAKLVQAYLALDEANTLQNGLDMTSSELIEAIGEYQVQYMSEYKGNTEATFAAVKAKLTEQLQTKIQEHNQAVMGLIT